MSSLEWSDDEEQAVDVPAPSNFSIAYTMATDDCIPLKSSLMGQSSMMAQPVGPGPVEEGHQVEVEEEEKTEATPQAPEEKAEFKTPQANGTGAAEASATHRPTEIDTTPKQATSPTSAYDENCDNDAEIARNLQQELDAESEAVDFQQQLQKALGGMDGSMTGWDFREELLTEEAPKCEVLEIEDEENEADAVNPLKARFCESVQRSNYKKRLQMKEEVAIASENSEGDEPGKKKMKTHEKCVFLHLVACWGGEHSQDEKTHCFKCHSFRRNEVMPAPLQSNEVSENKELCASSRYPAIFYPLRCSL